jgi:hypothetical protein
LVIHINNLNGQVSVTKELRTEEGPSELQADGLNKTAIPVEVISTGKVVSPVARDTPESQSQDRYLKECDEFIRESQKQRDEIDRLLGQLSGKDVLPQKQDVRGCPLIAVMIHVTEASTRDYHSEVDTSSHEVKHLLAYRLMISVRWPLAGLHLSRM